MKIRNTENIQKYFGKKNLKEQILLGKFKTHYKTIAIQTV